MSTKIQKDAALALAQGILALMVYEGADAEVMAEIRSWPVEGLTAEGIAQRFEKLSADAIAAARAVKPPAP